MIRKLAIVCIPVIVYFGVPLLAMGAGFVPEGMAQKGMAQEGNETEGTDAKETNAEGAVSEGTGSGDADANALCSTAMEVIEKNLAAVGGIERLRAIESLIIEGEVEEVAPPPKRKKTLHLNKPALLKEEGLFSVIVFDGEKARKETRGKSVALEEADVDELRYRAGFVHNAYSLLNWEAHFEKAELKGIKRYGPIKQYVLLFPDAQNGRDFVVYIDSKTFLIDRIVFIVRHSKAKTLKVVNRLRDYKSFDGIMMPTFIIFDRVGWKAVPSQFQIHEVRINPEINDKIFEKMEISLGRVTRSNGSLQGEVMGKMEEGYILTNFRISDMADINVSDRSVVRLEVGGKSREVTFLADVQSAMGKIKKNEIYLCRYPVVDYPRMILISLATDLEEAIPCNVGDTLLLTKSGQAGEHRLKRKIQGDENE